MPPFGDFIANLPFLSSATNKPYRAMEREGAGEGESGRKREQKREGKGETKQEKPCRRGREGQKAREISKSAGVRYGVATISRLLNIIDLFCRISSLL